MVVIVYLLLYIWQPLYAGMYSDDWGFLLSYFTENSHPSAPFSLDRLTHFMQVYANRPISGVMYYIVNSISDYNLVLIHTIIIIGVLVTLYCFYLFSKEFFKFLGYEKPKLIGALSSLIWTVSPWTLGVTVWYSSSINLLAFIFFSLSMYYLFKGVNQNTNYYIRVGIYYLLGSITYESFFFQYFIFIAIIWMYKGVKSISKKSLLNYTMLLTAIVAVAVIWNRITPLLFTHSIHKEFNPYFIQTLAVNIVSFPYVLVKSFGLSDMVFWVVAILSIIYISYYLFHFKSNKKSIQSSKSLKIIILLLSGIFAGLLIYSAAGYTIWGMGSRSRTMFVASFYIPLIIIILSKLYSNSRPIKHGTIFLVGIIFFTLSFTATLLNKLEWVKADNLQKEIIHHIPIDKIADLDSNTVVIVVAPFRSNWISVIDAPWAIDYQMKYGLSFYDGTPLKATSKAHFVVGRGIKHPVKNINYQNYWDGEYLYQGYDLKENASDLGRDFYFSRLDRFNAQKLFVWNYYDKTFQQIKNPQILEYKPFYNYDYWVTWIYSNWIRK